MSCSGLITASGEPTLAITISTLCLTRIFTSWVSIAGSRRMMMFGQTGAVGPFTSAQSRATRVSQASSSSIVKRVSYWRSCGTGGSASRKSAAGLRVQAPVAMP